MPSVRISIYGRTREVWRALDKRDELLNIHRLILTLGS